MVYYYLSNLEYSVFTFFNFFLFKKYKIMLREIFKNLDFMLEKQKKDLFCKVFNLFCRS